MPRLSRDGRPPCSPSIGAPRILPVTTAIDAAIKESLSSDPGTPVAYFTEYLESDRFPVEEATAALSAYIRQKYAGRPIDVVIAVSDPAVEFVRQHRSELFPNAPLVVAATEMLDTRLRSEGPGATGLIGGVGYDSTLDSCTSAPAVDQARVSSSHTRLPSTWWREFARA